MHSQRTETIIIISYKCWQNEFPSLFISLSFTIRPYRLSLLASPLYGAEKCPHKGDGCNPCWLINTGMSMRRSSKGNVTYKFVLTWPSSACISDLAGLWDEWKVNCTAAILWGAAPRICLKTVHSILVYFISFFFTPGISLMFLWCKFIGFLFDEEMAPSWLKRFLQIHQLEIEIKLDYLV